MRWLTVSFPSLPFLGRREMVRGNRVSKRKERKRRENQKMQRRTLNNLSWKKGAREKFSSNQQVSHLLEMEEMKDEESCLDGRTKEGSKERKGRRKRE